MEMEAVLSSCSRPKNTRARTNPFHFIPNQMTSEASIISIEIPPDAEVGDFLTFSVNGTSLELCVPHGTQPGDVLEVQLAIPSQSVHNNRTTPTSQAPVDNKDETTRLTLLNGISLEFFHELPHAQDGTNARAGDHDGTHAHIWPSARYCVEQVLGQPFTRVYSGCAYPPKRILELGSGTGVLGLSFASSLPEEAPSVVILSDVQTAIPLLKHNAEHNRAKIPSSVCFECHAIDWTKRNKSITKGELFDLIVGSDLLYNVELLQDLVKTIMENLAATGIVLLSVRWRKPNEEREFFRAMHQRGFQWSILSSPHCSLDWNDFGNPQCAPSNQYFVQRKVSVNGVLYSLADISEELVQQFSDQEYEAFENSFIQVYVGTRVSPTSTLKRNHQEMDK